MVEVSHASRRARWERRASPFARERVALVRGIRALRRKSCFDRTVIRIGVIVFVAWIVFSVPTVLLFGVLVRAGRRQPRTSLTIAGGAPSVRAISTARGAAGRTRPLGARSGLLG